MEFVSDVVFPDIEELVLPFVTSDTLSGKTSVQTSLGDRLGLTSVSLARPQVKQASF